jgi:hypothetical protein
MAFKLSERVCQDLSDSQARSFGKGFGKDLAKGFEMVSIMVRQRFQGELRAKMTGENHVGPLDPKGPFWV